MSGASREHNAIATNLIAAPRAALRGGPCQVFGGDMRVFVPQNLTYAYPDVSVVCGQQQYTDEFYVDTLLNPTLLVNIQSPSTARYDRTVNINYRRLPSLREYLLVAQDAPFVERFEKHGDLWVAAEHRRLDATFTLESVGVSLALADVYEGAPFPDTA